MKMDEPTGRILFEESQHFPKWTRYLLAGVVLFTIIITLVGEGDFRADSRDMWIVFSTVIPLQLSMIYLFAKLQLEKTVTSNGLYYRWKGWQKKYRYLEDSEIEKVEMKNSPLHYGYSFNVIGYGKVYNMSTGKGLQFFLKNGKKIFFGTDRLSAFEEAVQEILSAKTRGL